MITLFRRIREQLIRSGSLTKYLLYAAGEILLVVIGILIALQVNNWNEERIETAEATEFRLRLLDDLYEEIALMDAVIDYANIVFDHANRAMDLFESGEISGEDSADQFLIDLYQASQIQEVSQPNSTYQELLSSGKIGLIQNDSLRSIIIIYYSYDWSNSIAFRVEDPYRENIRNVIPSSIQTQIREGCGDVYVKIRKTIKVSLPEQCDLNLEAQLSRSTASEILNNEALKSDLRYRIGNLDAQLNLVRNWRSNLQTIITDLEAI
ncbi:DUF6090 family protein [Balneola sp. MJW-20]|uniref:DUF6090 family protein n=1 Tax=Gracilimonas aurantiaca TaxID=3234185 RepID=UPI0034662E20